MGGLKSKGQGCTLWCSREGGTAGMHNGTSARVYSEWGGGVPAVGEPRRLAPLACTGSALSCWGGMKTWNEGSATGRAARWSIGKKQGRLRVPSTGQRPHTLKPRHGNHTQTSWRAFVGAAPRGAPHGAMRSFLRASCSSQAVLQAEPRRA